MATSGDLITYADMAALATLANTKLSPGVAYSFPPFAGSDQIALPNDITPNPTYGTGSFPDGSKITVWLYSYKTISGNKTYSWQPLVKAFYGKAGSGTYSITWDWTSPTGATAPEGYVLAIPYPLNGGWQFIWQDIGLVSTFTEDGTFSNPAWKFDTTLDQDNGGSPSQNLPCGHGAWLKPWNLIHHDLFNGMDLFGGSSITFDPSFLLSGPWCVSVAPKCYLYINSTSIYDNIKFWYSESDSVLGNEIAPESDMLNQYTGGVDGANTFNWSENVIVTGRMVLLSVPNGQSAADWTLSASPGITPSFDPNYFDPINGFVTGLIFDFDDVPYTVGTPLTITATPHAGTHVLNTGNPAGGGCFVDCVFTGDKTVYSASDDKAIHYAGVDVKTVALPDSLTAITFTTGIGGTVDLEAHHRVFCEGVFTANTLPTLGPNPYLDQDLPQYDPSTDTSNPSSRRTALNNSLPYIPHVDNRGALWPVFRDTDFTPDYIEGQAFRGGTAWQVMGSKYIVPFFNTKSIPPSGVGNTLTTVLFALVTTSPFTGQDIRLLVSDPNLVLYAKAGAAPTISDFDVKGAGGVWQSAAAYDPGFPTDNIVWYVAIQNPTGAAITANAYIVLVNNGTAPNATFFPTTLDDSNNVVPQQEGYSFHWPDPASSDFRPIPTLGYCVSSINVRRQPVDNGFGILLSPTDGTSDLSVDIGVMAGFGWNTPGTFQKLTTIVIPAGQAGATESVFLPVLSGCPLAYQASEQVMIRSNVNFQPQMHSQFFPVETVSGGQPYQIGRYNGEAWYDKDKAMLTFTNTNPQTPIVLPISSTVLNDLEALLNLLP